MSTVNWSNLKKYNENPHVSQHYPATDKSIEQLLQSRQLLQQLLTIQIPGLAVPLISK